MKLSNISSAVVYNNVFDNVDLEYELTPTKLKESIVLTKKQDKNTFEFAMDLGGLYPKAENDGSISLYGDAALTELTAVIAAPYMVDARGVYSEAVAMSLVPESEEYILTVTADKTWLDDEARQYPVIIDPTIELEVDRKGTIDCYVDTKKPTTAFGYGDYILAGNSTLGKTRTFIKFNLPDLPDDNCIITNATINFYQYDIDMNSGTENFLNLHKVKSAWDNESRTVTWDSQPEFESNVVLDYAQFEYGSAVYQFDITRLVKEWYNGTTDNYGVVLKAEDETIISRARMISAEERNLEYYPNIYVTFKNNKGIEDCWSYSAYGIDTAGTAYVNDYTGNLVYSMPILSSISQRMPLTLSAVFNNYCAGEKLPVGKNRSSRTTPGKGFRLNIQETVLTSDLYGLTGDALEKYPYVYTDGDGTEHYIQKVVENEGEANETTTYKDEDGLGLTLIVSTGDSYKYRIHDKGNTRWYFNSQGNLFCIKDNNDNSIRIYYKSAGSNYEADQRIDYVTDGAGHTYTFTYYISNGVENDYIEKITDNAGRVINFDTSAGLLRKVTYSDGTVTKLFYEFAGMTDSVYKEEVEGMLDYVVANDGYGLNFNYTSEATGRRISAVIEYCATDKNHTTFVKGQRVTFDRTKYNTTVIRTAGIDGCHYANSYNAENDTDTDTNNDGVVDGADDIITTLQFDNAGRTVSQQLKYGSGSFVGAGAYSYTSTTEDATTLGNKNRIASTGSLGKNVVNLLAGGNAESLSGWSVVNSDSVTAATGATAGEQYMGAKSLKLQNTAMTAAGVSYYRQVVTGISAGSSYTLSAYVKTDSLAEKFAGTHNGAYVQISAYDADGNALAAVYSESLCDDTDTGIDNGWRRLTVTLPATANAVSVRAYMCLRNMTGNAYFDCIQLEAGGAANTYNMLENGSFEKSSGGLPTSWTPINTSYSVDSAGAVLNGSATSAHINGTKSIRITGETDISKGYKQTVYVEGNPNDTYIVSGWACGYPVNSTYHTNGTDDKGTTDKDDDEPIYTALFEIGILVVYDCTDKDKNVTEVSEYKDSVKFNTTVTNWQYSSAPFVLKYRNPEKDCTYTPKYVVIVPRYCKQANYVWFDHLMLSKEPAQTYSYDKEGNLISLSANTEQKANMDYDDETNDLTSYTDAVGHKTTMKYDSNHNLTHSTSQKGVTSAHGYNTDGTPRVDEQRNTLAHADATMAIRTEYEYHTGGEDTHGIKDGAYLKYFYDENGYATQYTCNWATGAPKTVTDANGTTTSTSYYGNYEKPQTVTTGSSKVTYTYDGTRTGTNGGNRIKSILFGNSSVGETYSFGYDNYGNRTKTLVGSTVLSENHYKAKNGLLCLTEYGNGDTIEYGYTNLGNVNYIYHNGNTNWSYYWRYDADGTPLMHRDNQNDRKYIYAYDSLGRLVREEVRTDNSDEHIGFVEQGYDKLGNVNKVIANFGGRTSKQAYSYSKYSKNDANGEPIPNNSASYAKDNLPTYYGISGTRYAYYDYDAINRLTQRTFTTERKLYNNYLYMPSNRNDTGTRYCTTQLQTEIIDNTAYRYTYDNVGNIIEIEKGNRKNTDTAKTDCENYTDYRSYIYDALGQLTMTFEGGKSIQTDISYDALGNILEQDSFYLDQATLDETTLKNIKYTYSKDTDAGWNKLLTKLEITVPDAKGNLQTKTESFDYDEIGNPVLYRNATLSWRGKQLMGFNKTIEEVLEVPVIPTPADPNPTETTKIENRKTTTNVWYRYDSSGLRNQKNVTLTTESSSDPSVTITLTSTQKTKYYYVGDKLAYQITQSGIDSDPSYVELYFFYDSYGKLSSIKYVDETYNLNYYVTTNAQGDVLGIYSASGVLKASYEYDAWGNATVYKVTQDTTGKNIYTDITDTPNSTHIAAQNPIRYRGYYYDSETGLYYLQSRYYDPEIGRFINADGYITTGQGVLSYNMFAYCGNNPIIRQDSEGEFWETALDVVSLALSVADVVKDPSDPWAWVGLVGDAVDLIPFVTGVGEITDGIKIVANMSKNADNVLDVAKNMRKFAGKSTGSYEVIYKSGMTYVGKGSYNRALYSAQQKAAKYSDEVASITWKKADNARTAFKNEYVSMCKFGGPNNKAIGNTNSYNRIWSPGRKYYYEDIGHYLLFGGRVW